MSCLLRRILSWAPQEPQKDQASQGSLHQEVLVFGSQEVQVLLLLSLVLLALTQLSFGGLNVSVVYRAVLVGKILNFVKEW